MEAKQTEQTRMAAGIDQEALEQAARQGLANGAFEDTEDEREGVVEEFFPVELEKKSGEFDEQSTLNVGKISLAEKLEARSIVLEGRSIRADHQTVHN